MYQSQQCLTNTQVLGIMAYTSDSDIAKPKLDNRKIFSHHMNLKVISITGLYYIALGIVSQKFNVVNGIQTISLNHIFACYRVRLFVTGVIRSKIICIEIAKMPSKCLVKYETLRVIRKTMRIPIGGWFNIKMPSYQYRNSHCGDKTILRPSYLHNGISYTGKMTSLF